MVGLIEKNINYVLDVGSKRKKRKVNYINLICSESGMKRGQLVNLFVQSDEIYSKVELNETTESVTKVGDNSNIDEYPTDSQKEQLKTLQYQQIMLMYPIQYLVEQIW